MFVFGLDIGYSNLKLCFGETGETPKTAIHPAGAAPAERLPGNIRPGSGNEGFRVQVNGKSWAAGIHPSRFEIWERSLHPDYSHTDSYKALFYTALIMGERDEIDLLVTGLPVTQFDEKRESLTGEMQGEHTVAGKRTVKIKRVEIVPQPVGGFMDALANADADTTEMLAEGRVLVVDPGHFSFDWVLINGSALQKQSSGSSTEAMSAVLETAAAEISDDYGGRIEPDRIEQALQQGKNHVLLFGKKVDFAPYLDQASREVSLVAIEKLRTAMRKEVESIDAVIVPGGGAKWWVPITKELFPESRVISPDEPILANARGFFELGASG
ncbi:ParM/StbA family protein [Methylohalobius crimeensis]|uniref:ParM/StbA family protein n=1 Tax=Methylohalobius crimeensis TaxID=244365 RepID=UPI0003B5EDC0|nr:ParM/StbA family protein [Methylohalobius crimeensis]